MTAPAIPVPAPTIVKFPNVGRAAFFGAMLGAGIALVLISAAAVRIALERGAPLDVHAKNSAAVPTDMGATSRAPAAAAADAGTTSNPGTDGPPVADAE